MGAIRMKFPVGNLLSLLVCCAISVAWGVLLVRIMSYPLGDFQAVFYAARTALHHLDPYNTSQFLSVYRADNQPIPVEPDSFSVFFYQVATCINLPTSLFLLLPLAALPWAIAQSTWMILTTFSMFAAALLIWALSRAFAPDIAIIFTCLMLSNFAIVLSNGNLAGVAISLCVIATCCFIQDKYIPIGVLCLAVSLVIKPHCSALIWVYFMLAGKAQRRRAISTAIAAAVIFLCAAVWATVVSPHWITELSANLSQASAMGNLNDPGPTSLANNMAIGVIDLQALLSLINNKPSFYNPLAYLLCAIYLFLWARHTFRLRSKSINPWIALAPLVPISLLVTYHRPYDAKLLLLLIPACAIIWARGGAPRWPAFLLTALAILFTSDMVLLVLTTLFVVQGAPSHLLGPLPETAKALMERPAPLALSAVALFYLWFYLKHAGGMPSDLRSA
jgi:hypothetical protein